MKVEKTYINFLAQGLQRNSYLALAALVILIPLMIYNVFFVDPTEDTKFNHVIGWVFLIAFIIGFIYLLIKDFILKYLKWDGTVLEKK